MEKSVTSHVFISCGLYQGVMRAGFFVRKGQPEPEVMARQAEAVVSWTAIALYYKT